jgi:HK97 family phage major capsid protein
MNKKTIQVRFLAVKDELRGIYAKAKNENRALTEDEAKKATELRGDLEQIQSEMLIESCERASAAIRANGGDAEKEAEFRQAFNKALIDASKNGQQINLRAASLIDKADAQPLTELTVGDIVGPLESGIVFDLVGCKVQTGLTEDWLYPVIEAVEASLAGEAVQISDSDIDINSVKPTPQRVAISIPVTRTALVMTNDRLFDVVRTQMNKAIARTLNKWMFTTEAINGVSGPFMNATTKLTYAGDAPTYKEICNFVGSVDATGIVPGTTAAFVMNNKTRAALKATPRGNGDRMVIENNMIDGVPVFVTEHVADGTIDYGYFSYVLVGQFGESSLVIDAYTLAKKNMVQITLNTFFDIKAVRNQALGTLTKA